MHHRFWFWTALAASAILFIFAGTPVLAASSFTSIYDFQPETSPPLAPLVADSAGNFYGVAAGPGAKTAPIPVSSSSSPLPRRKVEAGP
jgi:hypothetical protein